MSVLLIIAIILAFLTADFAVQRYELRQAERAHARGVADGTPWLGALGAVPASPPPAYFVSGGHAWAYLDPEGLLRIGVDGLAAAMLGDLDQAQVRPAGSIVKRGEPIATLRRGALEIEVLAPADGVVAEHNRGLAVRPDYVVRDPFGEGWFCRITPVNVLAALGAMRAGDEACDWLAAELGRLRDALAKSTRAPALAGAARPDGTADAGTTAGFAPGVFRALSQGFFGVGSGALEARAERKGALA